MSASLKPDGLHHILATGVVVTVSWIGTFTVGVIESLLVIRNVQR